MRQKEVAQEDSETEWQEDDDVDWNAKEDKTVGQDVDWEDDLRLLTKVRLFQKAKLLPQSCLLNLR